MSRRTRVPSDFTPDQMKWADDIERRQVAAVSQLGSTASTSEIISKINSLITAMQTSAAMEST